MMDISLTASVRGQFYSGSAGIIVPELYSRCFDPMDVTDFIPALMYEAGKTHAQAKVVMKTREDAAKILSEALTKLIIEEMSKNDTEDGYPKENR